MTVSSDEEVPHRFEKIATCHVEKFRRILSSQSLAVAVFLYWKAMRFSLEESILKAPVERRRGSKERV